MCMKHMTDFLTDVQNSFICNGLVSYQWLLNINGNHFHLSNIFIKICEWKNALMQIDVLWAKKRRKRSGSVFINLLVAFLL